MDSILADAGGPAGVVHRIGDLLSDYLEKRLVITLMRPVKFRIAMGKGQELPFHSLSLIHI